MLGSVITARDRWLKRGGIILPSNATVNFLSYLISYLMVSVDLWNSNAEMHFLFYFWFILCRQSNQVFNQYQFVNKLNCCQNPRGRNAIVNMLNPVLLLQLTILVFHNYCLQLYMAPVTHPDRYSESIEFWRNVYGIDSEYQHTWNSQKSWN